MGTHITARDGRRVWSCKDCYWIHRDDVARCAFERLEWSYEDISDEGLWSIKRDIEKVHPTRGAAIMVLGTTSGAGKSLMVAALCRIFSDMGYTVCPYKSQNMSLNSFVTPDGDEMARIQELQARAARAKPSGHMNPILLKPMHDDVSQVIINGAPYTDMDVPTYYTAFVPTKGMDIVRKSISAVKRRYDIVVMEGAGSPAEINLGDGDIANMVPAEMAQAPCILVANVERGGAFAYAFGTIQLLSPEHRGRICGIIYNNMRGDEGLLRDGVRELEEKTGIPCLGIVPHIELSLPSEDSQSLRNHSYDSMPITIGVIRFPRIANFTDFDAFTLEDDVGIRYIETPQDVASADIIILPGTNHALSDLAWLRRRGLDAALAKRRGAVPIVGICGGYQMMGQEILDTGCAEADAPTSAHGLGLLDTITRFDTYEKEAAQVEGTLTIGAGGPIRGYEIHMGSTVRRGGMPLCTIRKRGEEHEEGVADEESMVYGTYLHGIFDLPAFRKHVLSKVPLSRFKNDGANPVTVDGRTERELDVLARTVEKTVDIKAICACMGVEYRHG